MVLASFLEMITDEFFTEFTDASVYFTMASVGSLLFGIRILLMMIGGDHGVDFDSDGGDSLDGHGGGFSLFSLLSTLSFLMGAGWMGLACRREWGLGALPSALIASQFGFALMGLSSVGMYGMRKMNSEASYDVSHCIGAIGRVYLKIPAKGDGRGQVEISVDGRRKVLPAVSSGPEIASFAEARVVSIQAGETLIVEPVA
mgnify:CR=1 FL=1